MGALHAMKRIPSVSDTVAPWKIGSPFIVVEEDYYLRIMDDN